VGKVVLNNEFPEKFALVMQRVYNDSVPFEEAEKECFEFSQREVGAFIVKKWGFPEKLETIIRSFDDHEALAVEKQIANLAYTISLADKICQKIGMGWRKPGGDDVKYGKLPELLGIPEGQIGQLEEAVKLSFAQSGDFH